MSNYFALFPARRTKDLPSVPLVSFTPTSDVRLVAVVSDDELEAPANIGMNNDTYLLQLFCNILHILMSCHIRYLL